MDIVLVANDCLMTGMLVGINISWNFRSANWGWLCLFDFESENAAILEQLFPSLKFGQLFWNQDLPCLLSLKQIVNFPERLLQIAHLSAQLIMCNRRDLRVLLFCICRRRLRFLFWRWWCYLLRFGGRRIPKRGWRKRSPIG